MTRVRLSKYHATGNDFLVWSWLDAAPGAAPSVATDLAPQAVAWCDRHRGIGADGLIVVLPGRDGADVEMQLFNADGGIAEMSGNGIRALVAVAVRDGAGTGDGDGDGGRLVVDTGGGRREIHYTLDAAGAVIAATVDMGPATFEPSAIPLDAPSAFGLTAEFHGVAYEGDAAGMGNPHFVVFVDDPAVARVTQHGPYLENDARFPKHTNVEFIRINGHDELSMRVWERGVGETLSCGTGACAAAAVARRRALVGDHVTVHVPGGDLSVDLGDTVKLGGPVVHVFDVDVDDFVRDES
ncbi:MAG: diaminopimelate epimerase [Acidimicrobiia bacterium]